MEVHPNEITKLKKEVDALLITVSDLGNRLKALEEINSLQATLIRNLERISVTKDEKVPPKKRKVALQPKAKTEEEL